MKDKQKNRCYEIGLFCLVVSLIVGLTAGIQIGQGDGYNKGYEKGTMDIINRTNCYFGVCEDFGNYTTCNYVTVKNISNECLVAKAICLNDPSVVKPEWNGTTENRSYQCKWLEDERTCECYI